MENGEGEEGRGDIRGWEGEEEGEGEGEGGGEKRHGFGLCELAEAGILREFMRSKGDSLPRSEATLNPKP